MLELGLAAYEGMIYTCVRLERYAEALEYVERARSDRLVELLARQERPLHRTMPPATLNTYERLCTQLRNLEQALHVAQEAQPDHPMTQRTKAAYATVQAQLNDTVNAMHAVDPDLVATLHIESIRYEDIQGAIPDQETALIEFFVLADEAMLAFVVFKTGPPLPPVILSTCNITALVNTWLHAYAAFRRNPSAEWQHWRETMDRTLATLYTHLFAPLKLLLEGRYIRKLIFIPHQVLHLLPLHALYTEERGQRRYLIDLYDEISYAPSAAVLGRCQARHRPSPQRLLLVCNPDRAGQYGRPLTSAELEAERIRQHYPEACIRMHEEASACVLMHEARESHLLHLICHGVFDFHQPLQSYLGFADHRLTLGECFEQLELPETSLVILSACETGMVEMSRVDEYIGLPSGFLAAGSPTVISSLWMVDDEATSLLMARVYENLQKGVTKTRALNEAQRWLRRLPPAAPITTHGDLRFTLTTAPVPVDYTHPFYWATFYLSGAS